MSDLTSNLVNDIELTKKFNERALFTIERKQHKYFQVFYDYTVEDVLMECWVKIVSQDISYDSTKSSFDTFVYRIVECKLIDLLRFVSRRGEKPYSLDFEYSDLDSDRSELVGMVKDINVENEEKLRDTRELLNSCKKDFNDGKVSTVMDMRGVGYTNREIYEKCGINPNEITKIVRCMKKVVGNRLNTGRTLSDILYGNEDELSKNKKMVLDSTYYIVDKKYGYRLSDVIKMVITGATYSDIGNKFGVPKDDVKSFLDKCQMIEM